MAIKNLVDTYPDIYAYCENQYMKKWRSININVPDDASESKKEAARRDAQKAAIDSAFIASLAKFPDTDEEIIWQLISTAHKMNLVQLQNIGIENLAMRLMIYDRCVSAHQSWNKSSGHSFERFLSIISSEDMEKNEVRFLLKSDVTNLIKNNKIANTPGDLHLVNEWADNFDLYAVQTVHGETHIFGCIQAKTSIRDRVGRDDQFSKLAMDAHFWVAEAVLNGSFFNMPKYYSMVNGGSITYPENNWHGVYTMTGVESEGRIYRTDISFSTMAKHAVSAAKIFLVNRSQLTRSWIAPNE